MLIDSHCHLNFLDDPKAAISNATAAGITGMLCIGVDEKGLDEVLAFAGGHDNIWATAGEHPGSTSASRTWLRAAWEEGDNSRIVALGEMGLDYFYTEDEESRSAQRSSFEEQMDLAREWDLPVVIHTRDASADTLNILKNFPTVRGVIHCFTETQSFAEQALAMDYYVSISGIVTFNAADNVRHAQQVVPLERLLVETDSPWLAPVPHRGKQNQPAFVADTCAYLAGLRGLDADVLAAATTENFFNLFTRAART